MQNFDHQLRFDKVTESLKVGTFLRHSVFLVVCGPKFIKFSDDVGDT